MLTITKHSGIYSLYNEQLISWNIEKTWDFFSSPLNLPRITPPYMGFKITSSNLEKVYPGQIITYKVGVLPFIKTNWVTEITHVRAPYYFVDEQRSGPYSIWHHEHIFKDTPEGVYMTDRITFQIPFGIAGRLFGERLVLQKIKDIFTYRSTALEKLLAENPT